MALRSAYHYYPFGMLMPGRYVSDTSQHCVTVTRPTWVWKEVTVACWDVYAWEWPSVELVGEATARVDGDAVEINAPNASDAVGYTFPVTPNVQQTLTLDIERINLNDKAYVEVMEQQGEGWVTLAERPVDVVSGGLEIPFKPSGSQIRVVWHGRILVWVRKDCISKLEWVEEDQLVTICDGDKDKYRFGYEGQEKDNELKGIGNSLNFTYRMHDTRVGRFFSIDPLFKKYPYYSPFVFSGNRVIDAVELEGLEPASRGNAGVYLGLRVSGMNHKDAQHIVDGMVQAEQRAIEPMVQGTLDATPIEDLYGVFTGMDFEGRKYNREEAALWVALGLIPGEKIEKVVLKGFSKTGIKWGERVFKNADEFRDAVKFSPDRVKAYESAAEQVAEKNGWKLDKRLSKMNKSKSGRSRKIYSNKKGQYFSVDTKTGSFEVHNKQGKHLGEVDFDGTRIDPADKNGGKGGHDLIVK